MSAELRVRVTPRAGRDALVPDGQGGWQVLVRRPPVDGEANDAVVAVVARALGVPPSSVSLASGHRSRHKTLCLSTLASETLQERLAQLKG